MIMTLIECLKVATGLLSAATIVVAVGYLWSTRHVLRDEMLRRAEAEGYRRGWEDGSHLPYHMKDKHEAR